MRYFILLSVWIALVACSTPKVNQTESRLIVSERIYGNIPSETITSLETYFREGTIAEIKKVYFISSSIESFFDFPYINFELKNTNGKPPGSAQANNESQFRISLRKIGKLQLTFKSTKYKMVSEKMIVSSRGDLLIGLAQIRI